MMQHSCFRCVPALGLAAALVGWSFLGPRIPAQRRISLQAGLAGLLVMVTRAPLGICSPQLWAGLRLGLVVGSVAATGVLATTSVPAVRLSMVSRELPHSVSAWLVLQIPLGTVWAEEAAFRAALAAAGTRAFGTSGGRLLQAAAFGLSHIVDARATGEPVVPTVLATGGAGWVFGWLAERSGSLAAPMLAHLAINEVSAAAALTIQRQPSASWLAVVGRSRLLLDSVCSAVPLISSPKLVSVRYRNLLLSWSSWWFLC